jgi:hypothetical protein
MMVPITRREVEGLHIIAKHYPVSRPLRMVDHGY